jgi:hypothetical protein
MTRTVTLTASAPTQHEMVLLECVARVCGVTLLKLGFDKVNDSAASEISVGTIGIRGSLSQTIHLPAVSVVGIVTTLVSSTAPELLPFTSSTDFAVAVSWMTNASQTLGVLQVGPHSFVSAETALSGTFYLVSMRCVCVANSVLQTMRCWNGDWRRLGEAMLACALCVYIR